MSERDQWSGRLGFVLAASGSAVGLGNLWKFPYITWNNKGGAFVLVYLACVLLIGLPVMVAEIVIGRRSQRSPVVAFAALGQPRWAVAGWLGVLTGFLILAFYSVVAGWSLRSFVRCLRWSLSGYQAPPAEAFGRFLANGPLQVALGCAFLALTALIVVRGVRAGIERATRVLMPALFAIMLYLCATALTLDGFGQALAFLFQPSFGQLTEHAVLEALGHAFFTLSLGMGAMITYGSYMQRGESIMTTAFTVAALDTLIALLACLIMFAIIFSVPSLHATLDAGQGRSTVGMLFVTLPNLFYTQMPGGVVLGPLFYVLVAFAALSSTISLLEVIVATCVDRFGWSRAKATALSTAAVFILSVACALSLGANAWFSEARLFGPLEALNHVFTASKAGVLTILDHVTANWLLPLGGLLLTAYAGWRLDTEATAEELGAGEATPRWLFELWRWAARLLAPVAIGWILVEVLMGGDFS